MLDNPIDTNPQEDQYHVVNNLRSFAQAVTLAALVQVAALGQIYTEVRPVFEKTCLPCHGPQTKSSGLDLSTRDGLLKGGDHGAAIIPGDPKASLLYKLVSHEAEPHMPLQGRPASAGNHRPHRRVDQGRRAVRAERECRCGFVSQQHQAAARGQLRPVPQFADQAFRVRSFDARGAVARRRYGCGDRPGRR